VPFRPEAAYGMGPFRRELWAGGHPVRYEVAGAAGEPVVMVHGLSGSTHWWARNLPALARRYRLYLVDLPGFGAMRRLGRQFVLAEAASWLSEWMRAVGLERAHVVGHSMGGYVAIQLAAGRPELVGRLVLVAPAGTPTGRSMLGHFVPLLLTTRYATPASARWRASQQIRRRGKRASPGSRRRARRRPGRFRRSQASARC
jgi:pimeloyl-ACP methyl ester carboxylesterase